MLKVLSITVVTGSGPDTLFMTLDVTASLWPFEGHGSCRVDCAAGTAAQWLATNGLAHIPTKWVEG